MRSRPVDATANQNCNDQNRADKAFFLICTVVIDAFGDCATGLTSMFFPLSRRPFLVNAVFFRIPGFLFFTAALSFLGFTLYTFFFCLLFDTAFFNGRSKKINDTACIFGRFDFCIIDDVFSVLRFRVTIVHINVYANLYTARGTPNDLNGMVFKLKLCSALGAFSSPHIGFPFPHNNC